MSDQPPATDLPEGDRLLGVPWRSFIDLRSLRGLGMIGVALVVLVWPTPSERVLAVLVGIALAGYAAVAVFEVVRHVERRQFPAVLSIGVAGGLAAALVAHPDTALLSVARAGGLALLLLAAVTLTLTVRRRQPGGRGVATAVGLVVAGTLLLVYAEALLLATVSTLAAALAAVGLIEVFHRSGTPDGSARSSATDGGTPVDSVLTWWRRRSHQVEDGATLRQKVFFEGPTARRRFTRFAALMGFASVLASLGVVVQSTAVVIGAMLVAPLMVPLMGTALALTMGWPRRLRRCAAIAGTGMALAIGVGALVGGIVPRTVDVTSNTEVLARSTPTVIDLAIAVAAGAAGGYALSRRDVSDSLPGVAVAISLVPPLTVVGLSWQQGAWTTGNGALLLFVTNATAILVAGGAVFVLTGAVAERWLAASRSRVQTVAVALLTGAAIVTLLLALNGRQLARSELTLVRLDATLSAWSAEHEDYRVLDQRILGDGTIVVDLAGPGRPPDLDLLLADLESSLDRDVTVQVNWLEQEQIVLGDD